MAEQLAVFGAPIEHSLSPIIHNFFAKQEGRDIEYARILVEENFPKLIEQFFAQGAVGCNVTVPCKLQAYELVGELTKRAQIAHAVNTIKRQEDNTLIGDNTDGFGFYTDILRLGCKLENSKVLIIGSGGATYGILPPLIDSPIESICIINRSLGNAQKIVDTFKSDKLSAYSFDNLGAIKDTNFDVIINASSMSMLQALPPIDKSWLAKAQFVYDLYYTAQGGTVFTKYAQEQGCQHCYDGLGMLVAQAALAYELWFGFMPDIGLTIEHMRKVLLERQAQS